MYENKINSQEREREGETFSPLTNKGKKKKEQNHVVTLIHSRGGGEKKEGLIESHGSYNESERASSAKMTCTR